MLTKDGNHVDGSWLLTVFIDTLGLEKKIRVMSDWPIGKVINRITDGLKAPRLIQFKSEEEKNIEMITINFSDYSLWWPDKSKWILHKSSSLSQYGIQADTWLKFTPSVGPVKIQLPDLQERIFPRISFAEPVFRVVMSLCKSLGIRHPEELSLMHPSKEFDSKQDSVVSARSKDVKKKTRRSQTISHREGHRVLRPITYSGSESNLDKVDAKADQSRGIIQKFGPPKIRNNEARISGSTYLNVTLDSKSMAFQETSFSLDPSLVSSPEVGTFSSLTGECPNLRPLNFTHKCQLFTTWLDSSKCLMEHGYENYESLSPQFKAERDGEKCFVKPIQPTLQLRFKYGVYYDLNPKYDHIRINQLYHQAKWSILLDQTGCSSNEACLLAAIKLHVDIKTQKERSLSTIDNNASIYNLTTFTGRTDEKKRPCSNLTNHEDVTDNIYSSIRPDSLITPGSLSPMANGQRLDSNIRDPEALRFIEMEIDKMLDELGKDCDVENCETGTIRRMNQAKRVRSASGNRALVNENVISIASQLDASEYEDMKPDEDRLPHLESLVRLTKYKKPNSKFSKQVYIVMREAVMHVYKDKEVCRKNEAPIESIDVRGCYIEHEIDFGGRFTIHLHVPLVKTNLSFNSAMKCSQKVMKNYEDEMDVMTKLKSRASFLSLTSLANFISGGLNNAASFIAGLVQKISIELKSEDQFIQWMAICRIASQLGPITANDKEVVTMKNYNAEIANIKTYMSSIEALKVTKGVLDLNLSRNNQAHGNLYKEPFNYLPLRMSQQTGLVNKSSTINHGTHRRPPPTPNSIGKGQTLDRPKDGTLSGYSSRSPCENCLNSDEMMTKIIKMYEEISSTDATSLGFKLRYITTWRNLQAHGMAYFIARFHTSAPLTIVTSNDTFTKTQVSLMSKVNNIASQLSPFQNAPSNSFLTLTMSNHDEILAISKKRLFRMDLITGEIKSTWKFSNIKGWHVNFELNELILYLAPVTTDMKTSGKVVINPTQVPVNLIAEYLGGHAMLSMRAPFKRQELDENTFYRLTSAGNRVSLAI